MAVMAPINSDSPSIIKDAMHSKYLHKKFKKMASTLLSEEQQQVQRSGLLNGSRVKNGKRWLDLESDREITSLASCTISQKSDNSLSNNNSQVKSPPPVGYLCPYCQVVCSKPSVLQKHIRAHTNERPYPCLPCGFAFKTKSNLYKHCRSRAHTFKLEKKCEKPTVLLMHGDECDESLTSEDESVSNTSNVASFNSRLVSQIENREAPKSIYKPKYRFMEQSLKSHSSNDSDEKMVKSHSISSLLLKIPSNTNPSVSTQSSFTLGSSPSPESLQHHISKLISENQAIVETNDPFWSKKLLNRTNSNENNSSISPVSAPPSPTDIGSPKDGWHSVGDDTFNICDKPAEKHSKLVLALLRPQFSMISKKFPVIDCFDVKPLNLTTNDKEQSDVQLSRKRSYSKGTDERSLKVLKGKINSTLSETSAFRDSDENKKLEDITSNPEGSIIKDLLLKGKEITPVVIEVNSGDSPDGKYATSSVSESSTESRSIKFICNVSNDSKEFKNSEKLEMKCSYYCKDSKASLKSPTNCPSFSESNSYYKNNCPKEETLLITSSTSSPGPLLGSTPLIEFHKIKHSLGIDLNKKISKETRIAAGVEPRILTTTTLQSLEELSKCPMRSNLQLFGGELKIIDSPVEEMSTLELPTTDSLNNSPESSLNFTLKQGIGTVKEDNDLKSSDILVKIAKQSLHSGGSIMQTKLSNKQTTQSTSLPDNGTTTSSALQYRGKKCIIPIIPKDVTSIRELSPFVPYISKIPDKSLINPLTNLTAYNPLTLPASLIPPKSPEEDFSNAHSIGVTTIVHGGKEIPYVPGMPGPHTLLPINSMSVFVCDNKFAKLTEKKTISQQDQLSRIAKAEQILSIHNKSTSHIPAVQLNNETKSSPVERGNSALRSHDDSPKTSAPKPSQMIVSPMEPDEKGMDFLLEKKFLRPSSLPLKPGTFVPKKQSMGTPVLSLVSPETPRPRKSYGQLYLNGHAYTYLGLKCSTRMFFCTLNKPQPLYIPLSPEHNKVSMYSNWKVCTEADPNPYGLNPGHAMALYDSRHRSSTYTLACSYIDEVITHSSYWTSRQQRSSTHSEKEDLSEYVPKRVKIFAGGFESNEDYIYIRGRGRGRYMCEECGIRCKKPSMLKKHIRTHTDVRPFTCTHCKFSFKTKGNLTKHMKSKSHYKKCINLNINTVPTINDNNSSMDEDDFAHQQALSEGFDPEEAEEEDDEEEEDTEDDEDEEDEECLEREAVQSLLTLSGSLQSATKRAHVTAGLVAASARPNTYPYSFTQLAESTEMTRTLNYKSGHRENEKVFLNTGVIRDVQDDVSMQGTLEEADGVEGSSFLDSGSDPPLKCKQTTPMDLTNKSEKTSTVCEAAMLLASLCSTMERLPASSTTAMVQEEDSTLLQAYLTERAMQDSRMKQHQYKHKPGAIELLDHQLKKTTSSKINISAAKENALGILAQTFSDARKLSASELSPGSTNKPQAEFLPPSSGPSPNYVSILEDGRSVCNICNKVFSKPSQLRLHVNIHYFERPFRCESCAVSFRTKGHLQKHQRSVSHFNKVSMNSTFGTATTTNPRPFKCDDCKIAFRIHGHLAKHLRSKMHIMKLECLGKLPFGTYAELERSGINMNDIDTTDCDNSLESLQLLAQKLYEKDPSKLGQWDPTEMMPQQTLSSGDSSSEGESEDIPIPLSLPTEMADCSGLSPTQRIPPLPLHLNATSQSVSEPGRFKGPKHKPEGVDNSTQSLRPELMCNRRTEPH